MSNKPRTGKRLRAKIASYERAARALDGETFDQGMFSGAARRLLDAYAAGQELCLSPPEVRALYLGTRAIELDRRAVTARVRFLEGGVDAMATPDCSKAPRGEGGAHAWRFEPGEPEGEPGHFVCSLCGRVA